MLVKPVTQDDTGHMGVAVVVSGGQSGVDRAALDAARQLHIPYGGWCPANGWAEDMPEPPGLLTDYPNLIPTHSAAPAVRIRRNVHDSGATLILHPGGSCNSPGSVFALVCARRMGRPFMVARWDSPEGVDRWMSSLPSGTTVNVAGPRESEAPGAYAASLDLLLRLLAPPPLRPSKPGIIRPVRKPAR